MRFLVALSLLALIVLGVSASYPEEEHVLVLGNDNFDNAIAEFENILVEFYAPWCGHCKNLAPEYAAAATALSSSNPSVKLAKVDATVHGELGQRFSIQGYPSLIFFHKGQQTPYGGGRTKDLIISWLNKNTLTSLPLLSETELFEFLTNNKKSVVLYQNAETDQTKFVDAARNAPHGFEFAATSTTGAAHVKLYAPHKPETNTIDYEAFDNSFVTKNGYDVVSEFDREDFNRLAENHHWIVLAVLSYHDSEAKEATVQILRELALEFPTLGLTYADSAMFGRAVSQIGGTGEKFPTAIAVSSPNNPNPPATPQVAFDETTDFNTENLRTWLNSLKEGKPLTFKKSEPIPAENNGPVRVLVHKTFQAEVLDSKKNVFVEFYAPWCGHCKSLAPTWDRLGEAFESSADVVIAKIDATANYVDASYGITGFPTLIFFKADGTTKRYEEARDFDTLVDFVTQQTGVAAVASHAHDEL